MTMNVYSLPLSIRSVVKTIHVYGPVPSEDINIVLPFNVPCYRGLPDEVFDQQRWIMVYAWNSLPLHTHSVH